MLNISEPITTGVMAIIADMMRIGRPDPKIFGREQATRTSAPSQRSFIFYGLEIDSIQMQIDRSCFVSVSLSSMTSRRVPWHLTPLRHEECSSARLLSPRSSFLNREGSSLSFYWYCPSLVGIREPDSWFPIGNTVSKSRCVFAFPPD